MLGPHHAVNTEKRVGGVERGGVRAGKCDATGWVTLTRPVAKGDYSFAGFAGGHEPGALQVRSRALSAGRRVGREVQFRHIEVGLDHLRPGVKVVLRCPVISCCGLSRA